MRNVVAVVASDMTNPLQSPSVTRRVLRFATRAAVTTALVTGAAVAAVAVTPTGGRTIQAAGEAFGSGGEYHALAPERVLDTRERSLDVAPFGRKATNETFEVTILGKAGLPAPTDADANGADDKVLAVAVNITVVNPSRRGFLRAWGTGADEGDSSLVNFQAGEVVPNSAVLRPGRDGKLTIRVATPEGAGRADVLIDVFGWFSTSGYVSNGGSFGARLVPAGPGRILDTREAAFGAAPMGAASQRKIDIRGVDSTSPAKNDIVPADTDVVGVLLNITAVNNLGGSAPTYLALTPTRTAAGSEPTTSNLNLMGGKVRSALAMVPLNSDGSVYLYNRAGSTHAILDVVGYLIQGRDPGTREGRVVPLVAPFRAFDTRQAEFDQAPLPPAYAEDWSFEAFVADVRIGNEPVGAQLGLIGNLTAANLARRVAWEPAASYLTAYPTPTGSGTQAPQVSNLVISEGEVMPNMALIKYGSNGTDPNQIRFYNRNGYLDYLLDVTAVVLAD
jgi:hypothetical protein